MHGHTVADRFASAAAQRFPWAFLVSMAQPCNRLGIPEYLYPAYQRVAQSLLPICRRLGPTTVVEDAESSLMYRALAAAQAGHRPVHLALMPPEACYLSPALPTVAFPLWHLPDVPGGVDDVVAYRSWRRRLAAVDLVLAANRSTATALASVVTHPPALVPPPVADWLYLAEPWQADRVVRLRTSSVLWPAAVESAPAVDLEPLLRVRTLPWWHRFAFGTARGLYDVLRGWLSPRLRNRLKRLAVHLVHRARGLSTAGAGRPGPSAHESRTLSLGGLVYLSSVESVDERQNLHDLLAAFLLAFRERDDVTLVLQVGGDLDRRPALLSALHHVYHSLGVRHRCRIAVLTDDLSDVERCALWEATVYYVTASRAEACALAVQEALAAGRPVIAPLHSALADLLDEQVAFAVRTLREPVFWHTAGGTILSSWARLDWSGLHESFLASACVVEQKPARYRAQSEAARRRAYDTASVPVAQRALAAALARLEASTRLGGVTWAA